MDQDIASKERVLDCIKTTNRVINSWINKDNISPDKITQQDVISIFKGNVKNKLIQYLPDFKRASKSLRVEIDRGNGIYIKSVYLMCDASAYHRVSNKIEQVQSIVSKLTKEDYDSCFVFENEKQEYNTGVKLNLESISSIKF